MQDVFRNDQGPALQLGVTPEIAFLAKTGLAVDLSEAMVQLAWPGDSTTHKAIVANWLALPLHDASVSIAFGDACLSVLRWPDEYQTFFRSLRRVLRPGGILLLRCFVMPDPAETLAHLAATTLAGGIGHFSAFKLRLNMAAGVVNTGARIHEIFQDYFPDRARLAEATGWKASDIASINSYQGSQSLHSYPTRGKIAGLLPAGARYEFIETTGYELAERCPLLKVELSAA